MQGKNASYIGATAKPWNIQILPEMRRTNNLQLKTY